ncbi:CCR4-Not complex component, Not1-domain-containing protein [Cercophora newfieldiana]|uniref:General negative regulator of transcription subunit 1 n=1 Tax=Cercophora newfieldiana TaxID=92897 RepID=A0AA39XW90_9PEZI|nr:CCR4-Not complex component, Not1-domain-containing protein [Cercophora newfieldiana]
MVPQPRSASFSPNPTAHPIYTAFGHPPHPSYPGAAPSAGASPSTSSPTGSAVTNIVVAQVYLLLSTIRQDKDDPHKWDTQTESLRKLIDDHGMDVFSRYFSRLVVANASQIFPSHSRSVTNAANNYHLLVEEMSKLSREFKQSRQIAESIETGVEDIFRDFDVSTFMEHFQLDALEKTVLALAFKLGSRSDLKTKADAILSANFPTFVNILSRPDGKHSNLNPDFIAELIDRFIQLHPPNFSSVLKRELEQRVQGRYVQTPDSKLPPSQVLAALDLMRVLADNKPQCALAIYIQRTGPNFTLDEETCAGFLQNRPSNIQLSEEQVSLALTYTTVSLTQRYNPSVLVAALRRVLPDNFLWPNVIASFDQPSARITSSQFLRLYRALLPIAQEDGNKIDIQRLWGGDWDNPETQLSFICAFAALTPEQLDATTIPGLKTTFTLEDYARSPESVQSEAAYALKHPLASEAALSAVFNVALHSAHASQSVEARRLFQDVVVPNLPVFVVSAFGVPKPWPTMAEETLVSLFEGFISKSTESDFVLDSLWRRDKDWVKARLIDTHALKPMAITSIFDIAFRHEWLEEFLYYPNGFGLDLVALAHAQGNLNLQQWAQKVSNRGSEFAGAILQYLMIKASVEIQGQRPTVSADVVPTKGTLPLQVRTVSAMLQALEELLPTKSPVPELILVQRQCITAYPRLINYGEGFDDIIDLNGRDGNALSPAANARMEEHYKKMYSDEIQVRNVVEYLDRYKRSRDPVEQDVFASMMHGLFDEYSHYVDYPLEALATTAVLFGGVISHKLISDLPLQIALGMILEAVRDYHPEDAMYKFGLQALMQLFGRLREWPGFCRQLHAIPGLQGTEAWKQADAIVRELEEDMARMRGSGPASHSTMVGGDGLTNGGLEDALGLEQHPPPFSSVNVDLPPPGITFEEPDVDVQGKIQFVLNNLTDTTLQAMHKELREMLDGKHQQWFASHLVEERAKMQPNYHHVYLELVKQFEDKSLWAEVLRETYISVSRMLNSELTLQSSTERGHLKNLGGWLGLLTLARDKPIKHKNIAFKQLLIEAHDTKRLIVVIPFVCKVLIQGVHSNVFRPPNPWLMDIIHLLIDLYHNAELKLNQKFEIEVLCNGLNLDHKSIEPSGEILNRAPIEEVVDLVGAEPLDSFENLSLNGMSGMPNTLSSHAALPPIPDLGPSLSLPATEVISQQKLHDIVRQALTRSLQEIIQPVVDRSVTIAAISTQQMIHKDFSTEPDENRVRNAAINMVKSTAGSLALVTSKEPLRANFANYLRNLSGDLPQGLPEGIIMLCVNSNLDMASAIIEKQAEERAVPEIEEMIEPELEARRRHRAQRPSEPYMDPPITRWAMMVGHPYRLTPNTQGLNAEQMAIYDDFARQSRATAAAAPPSLVPSASDARSIANEVLSEQYNPIPNLPTPAETPQIPHLGAQLAHYPQGHAALANGRQAGPSQVDARTLAERVNKFLDQLASAAASAPEQHFAQLPRESTVLDITDALVQLIIKAQQTSEEFAVFTATQIVQQIFQQTQQPTVSSLLLESLVHVLESIRKIGGAVVSEQVRSLFHQRPAQSFLSLPLIKALLGTDLLDWRSIDTAMSKALQQRKEGSLEFLEKLMDWTILGENHFALYGDFVHSLEEAWTWITEEPNLPGAESFKSKVLVPPTPLPPNLTQADINKIRAEQMDYVFDEWTNLCNIPAASDKSFHIFVQQMRTRDVIKDEDDFFIFVRQAMDRSVERFDQHYPATGNATESFQAIDALVKMIIIFVTSHEAGSSARASFLDATLSLVVLVLNYHHDRPVQIFSQRAFVRFFAMLLIEVSVSEDLIDEDRHHIMLKIARRFYDVRPTLYPGFLYGWTGLISHRGFLPVILSLPNNAGWGPYTKLLKELLLVLGELIKPLEVSDLAKEMYQATLKLLTILQHDFPEYLAANHVQLTQSLPAHASQLYNMILFASPPSAKLADPFQPGLKIDRLPDIKEAPVSTYDAAGQLRAAGLFEILEQTLLNGPSEDAIAQIGHAISKPEGDETTFGFVPVGVNRQLIDAVVAHIGNFAVSRAAAKPDGAVFVPAGSDIKTLYMLVTELSPEARYYLLSAMVNELRYPNASTHYFSQALLDIFGHDMTDPDETEMRQQLTRILLERLVGYWPQPWGLMITIIELIKNDDKYHFFDLPFIKGVPEMRRLFEEKIMKASSFQ